MLSEIQKISGVAYVLKVLGKSCGYWSKMHVFQRFRRNDYVEMGGRRRKDRSNAFSNGKKRATVGYFYRRVFIHVR